MLLKYSEVTEKNSVLHITPNAIWWWGSNSIDKGSMEYAFIVIIPKSTLT